MTALNNHGGQSAPMSGRGITMEEQARRRALLKNHFETTPVVLYALEGAAGYQLTDGAEAGQDFTSRYLLYRRGAEETIQIYVLSASDVEQATEHIWFRKYQTARPPLRTEQGVHLSVEGKPVSYEWRSNDDAWLLAATPDGVHVIIAGTGARPQEIRLKRVERLSDVFDQSD
jgi:hypothetical protein